MPTSTISPIEEVRAPLESYLSELRAEAERVEGALAALGGSKPARRGPGRPRGKATAKATSNGASKSRAKRKGGRADQAVKLIEDNPGISASAIAKKFKMKPNYLYRVLGGLEKEKRVKKKGRQYFPV